MFLDSWDKLHTFTTMKDKHSILTEKTREVIELQKTDPNSKLIWISKGKYAVLVDKDYKPDGSICVRYNDGYVEVYLSKMTNGIIKQTQLGRAITNTESRSMVVDHDSRNRLDNRWSNLRPCTRHENAQNVKGFSKNSGYKGLKIKRNRLEQITIQFNYTRKNIRFNFDMSKVLGAILYDFLSIKYSPEFTLRNFKKDDFDEKTVNNVLEKLSPFIFDEIREPRSNK